MKCSECNGVGYKKISAISCAICERCGGIGEVKETNFDRITKSPEALAELMQNCVDCDDCPITDRSVCQYKDENCKKSWIEWLKQESKEK